MNLKVPDNAKKVLLHTCCAPCAGSLVEQMQQADIEVTLYFYNPNIYPEQEYLLRKKETEDYASRMNIPFIEGKFDASAWQKHIEGYENEPERGKRCTLCFQFRLKALAQYAHANHFTVITSSLGISRWKDLEFITQCGIEAANPYPEITYWDANWRKGGGSQRMYEIAKDNHFYKQEYCGCLYSLKEANAWREKNNKPKIPERDEDSTGNTSNPDIISRY